MFHPPGPILKTIIDGIIWTVGYQITTRIWDLIENFFKRRK